jgi:hypothetical protein
MDETTVGPSIEAWIAKVRRRLARLTPHSSAWLTEMALLEDLERIRVRADRTGAREASDRSARGRPG